MKAREHSLDADMGREKNDFISSALFSCEKQGQKDAINLSRISPARAISKDIPSASVDPCESEISTAPDATKRSCIAARREADHSMTDARRAKSETSHSAASPRTRISTRKRVDVTRSQTFSWWFVDDVSIVGMASPFSTISRESDKIKRSTIAPQACSADAGDDAFVGIWQAEDTNWATRAMRILSSDTHPSNRERSERIHEVNDVLEGVAIEHPSGLPRTRGSTSSRM